MVNKKSNGFLLVIVLLVAIVGFVVVFSVSSTAADLANTPEEKEVISALEAAYKLLDAPFEQLDLDQLSEILINHPYYQEWLPADEFEVLKNYTRVVQGEAATRDFGYLTSMQTKRMNQKRGAMLLRAAREKANAENREVSSEEMKALKEQNFGMDPWVPSGDGGTFVRPLKVLSIKIDGDRADLIVDDGAKTRNVLMVSIKDHWYVAGIK